MTDITPAARIRAAVATLRAGLPRLGGEAEHLAALRELDAVAGELEILVAWAAGWPPADEPVVARWLSGSEWICGCSDHHDAADEECMGCEDRRPAKEPTDG